VLGKLVCRSHLSTRFCTSDTIPQVGGLLPITLLTGSKRSRRRSASTVSLPDKASNTFGSTAGFLRRTIAA
jgi:hypothetical protein